MIAAEKNQQKIAAHIALFEGMKLCSLFPKYYDISAIAKHLDQSVFDLFIKIYQGVLKC
jgi:UDP-N-acetyl-alpha-D-muramoyl-L-alanyl-L-glutamate epimerase